MTTRLAALALAAAALACAGAPRRELSEADLLGAGPREIARAGWDRLLRNQAAGAGPLFARALAADGAEPWALLGKASLARRALDDEGEAEALLLLLERAPGHALGAVAARRLGELAERSPALATAAAGRLGALLGAGKLSGHTASRARSARAHALDVLGEGEEASRARREWGAVGAWTLSGPWSPYHHLDFRRPFPPEEGTLPAVAPALPGQAPVPVRALAGGDGVVGLEGEPAARGDVFYLAADLALSRGGEYLAAVGGTGPLRAWIDGQPLAERDPAQGPAPSSQVALVRLEAGTHRLLLKVVRGSGPGTRFAASLARADGAPCDLTVTPAPAGVPSPAAKSGPLPPALRAAELAARLVDEGGPAAAHLAVARDAVENDREAAKALLDEALAAYPASALLLEARAEAHAEDATLGERTARGRAEALLDRALAADAAASSARLARAELMRAGDRLDDARALLEALPAADAARPAARLLRARIAMARGHADGAERESEAALRESGACGAAGLLLDLARRRDAVARADDLARSLTRCPGGRERLAQHLRSRGDAAGAVELTRSLVRAAPARLDRRLELSRALLAAGQPAAAAAELAELEALWPRDPRLPRRRAELLERAGDLEGARAARERSLVLDGGDLALRRALALEQGREPLDDLSEDGVKALAGYRQAAPREEATAVYVLDHGAVEANPDGSYLERVHQVVSLADQRAVDRFAEVQVPAGGELLLARTLKRDGRVLEAEERGEKGTVSLPGVEPGDAAEWAWLRAVPARGPAVPGFTADAFFFRGDIPMWRTAYAAAAPAATGLRVESRRLEPPAAAREEGKRQVMRAGRERVPALVPEPGAPTEAEFLPMVRVGNGAGPDAVPLALADSLADASRPTLEIVRLAREIERSVPEAGRGGEPLLRAAWARVAGLVQGHGASLADQASQVLARGSGSRLLLLQSVLRALGVRARVAVARDFARDPADSALPRFDQYPFPLLHVEHGGRTWWIDPSAREIPFGSLAPTVAGAQALVLPLPGEEPRRAHVPPADPADARTVALRVELRAGGGAAVEGVEEYRGYEAGAYRSSLARVDATQRRQVVEQALARSFRGAALESLSFEGEPDLDAPLRVRWRILAPSWARAEDGRLVAEVPIQPPRLAARYAQRGTRETPLLITSPEELQSRIEVQVPAGVRPLPAPPVERAGPYGSYRREEKVEGGRLVRTDRYRLERGRIAPADFPAFLAFAMAVDEAHAAPMVFSSTSPGVAADPRIPSDKHAMLQGNTGVSRGHEP